MQRTFKIISANTKVSLASTVDAGCTGSQESPSTRSMVCFTSQHEHHVPQNTGCWGFIWLAADEKKKKKSKCVGGWYSRTKWGLINLSRVVSERASGAERPETPDDCRLHHWLCGLEKHQKIHHFNFKNECRLFPWCCKSQLFALCRWRSEMITVGWPDASSKEWNRIERGGA